MFSMDCVADYVTTTSRTVYKNVMTWDHTLSLSLAATASWVSSTAS